MSENKTIKLIYDELGRQTVKARQFSFDGVMHWIPKSQIVAEDLVLQSISLPGWLVETKGLEMYEVEY